MTHISVAQKGISRRDFLKVLGAASSCAFLPMDFIGAATSVRERWVNVPPSLALHSADGRGDFLPRLLDLLQEHGFSSTTYQAWYSSVVQNRPISKPVIISVDDLSMAQSACAPFNTFVRMKEWIEAAGMTAVFAVITEPVINEQPQRVQDEVRWDMMQAWVEAGFELATHTSYHSTFNAPDTGPRPDFTAVDYEAEIVRSAQLIEAKLGERQVVYQVQSLVLPFGSGYSYLQADPQIHSGIVAACRQTNIKFVVGIPQGREPVSQLAFANSGKMIYVGRIPPAYLADVNNQRAPYAEQTLSWIQAWRNSYHRPELPATGSQLVAI